MSHNTYFTHILGTSTHLTPVLSKARYLAKLDKLVKKQIPAALQQECCVANVDGTTLVLLASNPAWRHQLHYSLPHLLEKLRLLPDCAHITHIRCRVGCWRPHQSAAPCSRVIPPKSLSGSTKALLQETAAHVSSERLRMSLLRLAQITRS